MDNQTDFFSRVVSILTVFLSGVTGILFFFFLLDLLKPKSGSMMSEKDKVKTEQDKRSKEVKTNKAVHTGTKEKRESLF